MHYEADPDAAYVDIDTLRNFATDVFLAMGTPEDAAKISVDVLLTADLRGIESHGVGRLKYYYDRLKNGRHLPHVDYEVVKDTPTTAVWDANHGNGHAISYKAMENAISKARDYGLGAVSVRNSTHFGIAGYYVLMAVKEGMIGMTCTNARPAIAPTWGVKPMLGTNPLTFGFPTDEECPFILDGATSIIQRGVIEYFDRAGKPTPEGYVIGPDGEYRTDTHEILGDFDKGTAAFLPIGGKGEDYAGYKGYGYATVVELFSAVLSGGSFLWDLVGLTDDKKPTHFNLGHFFLAINPEFFMGLDVCKHAAGEICRQLRNSTLAPGAERIWTAGEKEYEAEQRVWIQGVPFNKGLQEEFNFIREELGLSQYKFPWDA